jgi:hypothetical protein
MPFFDGCSFAATIKKRTLSIKFRIDTKIKKGKKRVEGLMPVMIQEESDPMICKGSVIHGRIPK